METSFAITGKGYVIVAADTTSARSIVKMKIDEDKIKTLSPHLLMAYSGEPGTCLKPHIHIMLSSYSPNPQQATPSNLPNTSSATSVYTRSATSTLCGPQQPLPGSVVPSQSLCAHVNLTPSTSSLGDTIQPRMTPIFTGSTTSVR